MDYWVATVIVIGVVVIAATLLASKREPLNSDDEAKRLARLLVSEIALYNGELIELSRSNRQLHPDLSADLQRSRAMFEERIVPEDRSDHFEKAVRSIIANGDQTFPIELA